MLFWGVWVEGSSTVRVMPDGPSALREERRLRAKRVRGVVVVRRAGHEKWLVVAPGSPLRPDPQPPKGPRSLPWYDRLGRGGDWVGWLASRWRKRPDPFGRRRV